MKNFLLLDCCGDDILFFFLYGVRSRSAHDKCASILLNKFLLLTEHCFILDAWASPRLQQLPRTIAQRVFNILFWILLHLHEIFYLAFQGCYLLEHSLTYFEELLLWNKMWMTWIQQPFPTLLRWDFIVCWWTIKRWGKKRALGNVEIGLFSNSWSFSLWAPLNSKYCFPDLCVPLFLSCTKLLIFFLVNILICIVFLDTFYEKKYGWSYYTSVKLSFFAFWDIWGPAETF